MNIKTKFTNQSKTHYSRRLTSGLACETCRRRKTKCDGGAPCSFCSTNNIKCVHRASTKKKMSSAPVTVLDLKLELPVYRNRSNSVPTTDNSSAVAIKPSLSLGNHAPLLSTYTTKKPNIFNYDYRIPSITDQLSCHTFTVETAYTL
ncbi:unnamed protein product [Mucor hiemalis]